MFVRNVLKPGDVVLAAPLGARISLLYSESGALIKVFSGYDADTDISADYLNAFIQSGIVPVRIPQKGTATYVCGVLYTSKRYHVVGNLPEASEYFMLQDFLEGKLTFNFFAAKTWSPKQKVLGATMMSQTLSMFGFKVLPNYIIPSGITPTKLKTIINPNTFPFFYPLVMDYFIFRGNDLFHASTKLKQNIIKDIDQYLDAKGDIYGEIHCNSSKDNTYKFDWSVITSFNLRSDDTFILDSEGSIIFSHSSGSFTNMERPRTIACPVCGRVIDVPETGHVHCADSHCASRAYPAVQRFIQVMKLDMMTKEDYDDLIKVNPDYKDPANLLKANIYQNVTISTNLKTVLYSMILGVSEATCLRVCDRCNNSVETLEYYIRNPEKLPLDMKSQEPEIKRMVNWLKDSKNVDSLISVLHHPQVKLDKVTKLIPNAAPIFRNVNMFITGTFKRGSLNDIVEILQSYGAKVSTVYSYQASVVIVGSLNENNDAISISKARRQGTMIFNEDEFFKKYEIDDDLHQNL